jgi:hypothetical protein
MVVCISRGEVRPLKVEEDRLPGTLEHVIVPSKARQRPRIPALPADTNGFTTWPRRPPGDLFSRGLCRRRGCCRL